MLGRLGYDAEEALEELLNAALDFEALHPPAMQEFIDWFGKGQAEIKREQEQSGDMVRIMTVHGSKGLQAPVVFLPDTCEMPDTRQDPDILFDDSRQGEPGLPVWRLKGSAAKPSSSPNSAIVLLSSTCRPATQPSGEPA